jgi:hypothetical protein
MQTQKQSGGVGRRVQTAARSAESESVVLLADRLYRTAEETLRQRERYARLVAAGATEAEQQAALRVVCLCDELLAAAAREYHAAAPQVGKEAPDWWHRANAVWLACREYARRHRNCDNSSRELFSKRPEKFGELAMEYDLEASALLALKLALDEYRKVRPGCVLRDPAQRIGA